RDCINDFLAEIITVRFSHRGEKFKGLSLFYVLIALAIAIQLNFTFDDTTPDNDSAIGAADYEDPNATLTLTGLTSGSTLSYFGGLELQLDDDEELEIEGIPVDATASVTPILGGDIDFDTQGTPFFSDVDDLSSVFADLFASPFPNLSTFDSDTRFWNGIESVDGMVIGAVPNPATFTNVTPAAAVPEPSSMLSLLLIGVPFVVKGVRHRNK
ncbi:hypothetical protein, partial [Crocosphaera sp.]|uniref:hypothetical protein n=1 Tax=Crocosphaera sp. TaxID=2729996 RepID=UPI00260F3632